MSFRKDYEQIKTKFIHFISCWMNHKAEGLHEIFREDVLAYLSTASTKDGSQHTIYGIQKLILDTPSSVSVEFSIDNYLCRFHGNQAQQTAEVSCIAKNEKNEEFKFIAMIANTWEKENDWKVTVMRMDVNPFEGSRKSEFENVWHFDDPLAVLSADVHIPCILPEMDSPYYVIENSEDVLTEAEKIEECFYKFLYGIDWLMFKYVKQTLSDRFINDDKHHFISYTKFKVQKYRYRTHAFHCVSVIIHQNTAEAVFKRIVPDAELLRVQFTKEDEWKILKISKGESENA